MRWIEKLAPFAPFGGEYRPGTQNTRANYLSCHFAKVNSWRVYYIPDLCAGMGTTIRALGMVMLQGAKCANDYNAPEKDHHYRNVFQSVSN